MENMVITCIQCEEDFKFTVKEQEKLNKRRFDASCVALSAESINPKIPNTKKIGSPRAKKSSIG